MNEGNTTKNLVFGKDDALFGAIERQQQDLPFGKVLDAGTGLHSLRWLATLNHTKGMTEFTAITADATMQRNVQLEADDLEVSHLGKVIIGNWFDGGSLEQQLEPESYDVVLADYLIGAMDGFSPYKQDLIFPKLARFLKPGGRLYIVGLQPLPDSDPDPAKNIICRVRQVRDACILLAGHRCYREYPVDWIHRQVQQMDDLYLKTTSEFPILWRHTTIVRQINVGRSKLPIFASQPLVDGMKQVLDDLERQSFEATQQSSISMGFDYLVTCEKKSSTD